MQPLPLTPDHTAQATNYRAALLALALAAEQAMAHGHGSLDAQDVLATVQTVLARNESPAQAYARLRQK